jgi:hypothetical protein
MSLDGNPTNIWQLRSVFSIIARLNWLASTAIAEGYSPAG